MKPMNLFLFTVLWIVFLVAFGLFFFLMIYDTAKNAGFLQ